ncbi:MAG: CynX/NimT family MFS transporter [Anaerovoracaceae bacterium]|jgi:predicted MFS family arabinose efflux permease
MTNTAKHHSPWLILVIMLISMMAGAMCMNKVSPVLSYMVEDLGITSSAQSGLLISIFTFTGILLSIPMGVLITKYGTYKTGLFSLLALIIGSILGAIAPNYGVMLVSRLIEGIGLMFLGAIGPAAVAVSFAGRKSGTAMGLLMCYMSFGQILALNLAPIMAENGSWRNFWQFSAVFGIVALVLWIIFIRGFDDANSGEGEKVEDSTPTATATLSDVMKNGSVWLICITFMIYMLVHFGVFSYLPTYMTQVGGIDATKAGTLTSIASLVGIPIGILGGVIADKSGSIKKPLTGTVILFAILVAVTPMFSAKSYFLYVLLYGIVAMAEAGLSFTAVTKVVPTVQSAVASATLNMAQWIGAFLSTIVFGALLDAFGWNTTFHVMAAIAVIGVLTSAFNRKLQ